MKKKEMLKLLDNASEMGSSKTWLLITWNKNGHITPVEINAAVIGAGETTRVISLCDITERKKTEETLRKVSKSIVNCMRVLTKLS